jgi:hypothetical protein
LVVTTHSDALVSALTGEPDAVIACERPGAATMLHRLDPKKLGKSHVSVTAMPRSVNEAARGLEAGLHATGPTSRDFVLALFGRRPTERVVRSSLPASENLHKTGLVQRSKIASLDYLIGEQLH